MSQFFEIHPDNPQARLLRQAVQLLAKGGCWRYPPTPAMPWSATWMTRPLPTGCDGSGRWTTGIT